MKRSKISVTKKNTICFSYSEETFAVATNTNIFTSHFTWPCSGIRWAPGGSEAYAVNTVWGDNKFMRKYIYYGPLVDFLTVSIQNSLILRLFGGEVNKLPRRVTPSLIRPMEVSAETSQNTISKPCLIFIFWNNYCSVSQNVLFADPFWLRKTTTDPHIQVHVNIECSGW